MLAASGPLLRGVRVKTAGCVLITGDGDTLLPTERSAPGTTATEAVAVSLAGSPSGVVADTVAALVIVPLSELLTRAAMTTALLALLASEPLRLHVTVTPAAVQFQPDPENDTNEVLGDSVSTIVTPLEASGPRLFTVSV